jgi:hypothetical protein
MGLVRQGRGGAGFGPRKTRKDAELRDGVSATGARRGGFGPRKTRKDAELGDGGTVFLEGGVADATWGWLWLKGDRVFEPRKTRNTRN